MKLGVIALCLFAATGLPAWAAIISPTGYSMLNGEGVCSSGSFNYFDETHPDNTGTCSESLGYGSGQLLDGILGADDWAANLGNGNAYEWVGWRFTNPVQIVFDFGALSTFTSASVHANNASYGGVYVFATFAIEASDDGAVWGPAATYTTTPAEQADPTARLYSLPLAVSGRYLRATITDQTPDLWTFLSEFKFEGEQTAAIPEPSTFLLGAAGLIALAALRRGK